MTGGKAKSSVASLPPPQPKSPPEYPDLYGKRRELARVQMMEREIGFLQEELKSIEGLPPASRSCKEVADFVIGNPDPLIPTTKKSRRSCRFWKWLCGASSCCNLSWICCCCCSSQWEMPNCCDCTMCDGCCNNPCLNCHMPNCSSCFSCWNGQCCKKSKCGLSCCVPECCPSCPSCSCPRCTCCYPKCPKLNTSCSCCHKSCCCCFCFCPCYFCF